MFVFQVPLQRWLLLVVPLQIALASTCFAHQESPAELSGFDASEIFDVRDGGVVEIENAILKRLLYRCFQVSEASLRRAAQKSHGVSLVEVCANPRDYRFYPMCIRGVAREFKNYLAPDQNNETFKGITVLHLMDENGSDCLIAMPLVENPSPTALPPGWKPERELEQNIEIFGFFMGLRNFDLQDDSKAILAAPDSVTNKLNPPVFVARRVNWYPEKTSSEFSIDESDVLLAKNGVDYNRLRQLGSRIGNGITQREAISFYQLLHAASRVEPQLIESTNIELETMLQDPANCLGQPVSIAGHVRRVTEIAIEDAEIRERLGIEKYFQLDMFVPLKHRRIVIKPNQGSRASSRSSVDSAAGELVIENRFPITVCTCSLPIDKDDFNRDQVMIKGYFFKNWGFESELSIGHQSGAQQLAPLIIASQPKIVSIGPNYISYALMSFAMAVLAGALLLAWFMRPRRDMVARGRYPEKIELPD